MPEAQPFDVAFGQVMAQHRSAAGATQEDVARSARALGLGWKASTVGGLESGHRHWQPIEVLLAPFVLAGLSERGWVNAPTLPELLAEMGAVEPGFDGRTLAQAALGRASAEHITPPQLDHAAGTAETTAAAYDRIRSELGEAERKAARRYGLDEHEIAEAAHFLWARSLTEEREARVSDAVRSDPNANRRALRAAITRELLAFVTEHVTTKQGKARGTRPEARTKR